MKINTKKMTLVTRRRQEFLVLRRRFRFNLFCRQCADETEFLSLDDAVLFSGLAMREIVRLAEADRLHYLESSGGHLFVCRQSLSAQTEFTENFKLDSTSKLEPPKQEKYK